MTDSDDDVMTVFQSRDCKHRELEIRDKGPCFVISTEDTQRTIFDNGDIMDIRAIGDGEGPQKHPLRELRDILKVLCPEKPVN